MLNLSNPVQYNSEEEHYISSLPKKDRREWDSGKAINIRIKEHLRKHLLNVQKNRCAYCDFELYVTTTPEIEHIAPKGKYPKFMYEPFNLVMACSRCNGRGLKGTEDTIKQLDGKYEKCIFKIIHPYFDNPDKFLITTKQGVVCKVSGLTDSDDEKASNTIEMFDLNCAERVHQRQLESLEEQMLQILGAEGCDYLKSISEYKRQLD